MILDISSNFLDSFYTKTRFESNQICSIKSVLYRNFFVYIGGMQIALQTSSSETTSAKLLLADNGRR